MLGWIAELLPLFFVRWVALRHCERMRPCGSSDLVVMARPDLLIRVPDKMRGER